MKIALIGATGFIGSAILSEALNRGHQVTAVVRNIEKLPQHTNLTAKSGDVTDEAKAAALFAGHEAKLSSVPLHPGAKRISTRGSLTLIAKSSVR